MRRVAGAKRLDIEDILEDIMLASLKLSKVPSKLSYELEIQPHLWENSSVITEVSEGYGW